MKVNPQLYFQKAQRQMKSLRVEFPGAFYRVINRDDAGDHIIKGLRDRDLSP